MGASAAPLPHPATTFVGRDDDLAALLDLLARQRLVTLAGPGGSGKTRLALEAAHRLVALRTVAFVELALITSGVAHAVRVALGVGAAAVADDDGLEPLRGAINAGGDVLLVVDNCEHLVDEAAAVVADLVRWCPRLTVLATSREPLALVDETVVDVPPLGIDQAVQLFVDRSRGVLTDRDREQVTRIVERLDGLPLAIELAAALTRTMTLADIERALADRLGALVSSERDRPARHRSLRAAIEWSVDLLDAAGRRAFTELATFPAPFRRDDAVALTVSPDAVDTLVERSLVSVRGDAFLMLQTIREFALELGEPVDVDDRRDLAARFVAWAAGTAAATDVGALDDATLENARAALAASMHLDVDARIDLAVALAPHLLRSGWIDDGRRALEAAVGAGHVDGTVWLGELALAQGDLAAAHDAFAIARDEPAGALGLGITLRRQGRHDEARAALCAAERGFAVGVGAGGGRGGLARTLLELGRLDALQAQPADANARVEEALRLHRDVDDRAGVVDCLLALGRIAESSASYTRAVAMYGDALTMARSAGDLRATADALSLLANAKYRHPATRSFDDFAAIGHLHAECLELRRRLGDRRGQASALAALAATAYRNADLDEAAQRWTEALDVQRAVGDRRGTLQTLVGLANVESMLGRTVDGLVRIDEAVDLARDLDLPRDLAQALVAKAEIARDAEDHHAAADAAREAHCLALDIGDRVLALQARFNEAHACLALSGRPDDVLRTDFTALLADAIDLDHRHLVARVLETFACARAASEAGADAAAAVTARLLGAAEALRGNSLFSGHRRPSAYRPYEAAVAMCRAALGASFEAVWVDGRGMSIDEARALVGPAAVARAAEPPRPVAVARWRKTDTGWLVGLTDSTPPVLVPHARGMTYLGVLLERPRVPVAALDLSLIGEGRGATVDQPGIPIIDREALDTYRSALDDARSELDEARAWNDTGRVTVLEQTIDALLGQLTAVTTSGRVREDSSTRERARKAVSKCIREAIDRIESIEPLLADHLRRSVRTGYECVYDPPLR